MNGEDTAHSELKPGEPHPAALTALQWLKRQSLQDLFRWQEAFSSCAIEGNRTGEICSETLSRFMNNQPISDRYVLGLVFTMYRIKEDED